MAKVLAIVPTFNRPQLLDNLLKSLDSVKPKFDLLIMDNNSSLSYSSILKKKHPYKIKYQKLDKNLGPPYSNNIAIRYALKHKYDYIWILDDDSVIHKDALSLLLAAFKKNKKAGIAGSGTYSLSPPNKIIESGAFFDFKKLVAHRNFNNEEVDYVPNCSALISLPILKKHSLSYDENYFLHRDDMDLCLQVKELGYKVLAIKDSIAYHPLWEDYYSANSNLVHNDRRNNYYMQIKLSPSHFKRSSLPYLDLIYSIKLYMSGEIFLATALQHSLIDLLNLKMGKRNILKRLPLSPIEGKIKNKSILIPEPAQSLDLKNLQTQLKKHTKNCKITILPSPKSKIKKLLLYISLRRKHDLVALTNSSDNILNPILASKFLKHESNQLYTHSISLTKLAKFSLLSLSLIPKIFLKKLSLKEWRTALLNQKNQYRL